MGRSTRTATRRTIDRRLGVVILACRTPRRHHAGGGRRDPARQRPRAGAKELALGVAVDYDSADATISASDPTDCDGSHGSFPGPYFASVWFSFTATSNGQLNLSAPTTQGRADDYLAISFVYQQTGSGLTLIDCTAFGNDATWPAKKGQTYLIMEAGLSSAVTEFPPLSDMGGHGTIAITRSANEAHYSYIDLFTYDDCGFTVNGEQFGGGTFHLRPGKQGDATPYLFDNYEWHIVSTNPANGKWFREDGQGLYRDLHITNVEGTVYTFVSQEIGRPYTLTDMNGNQGVLRSWPPADDVPGRHEGRRRPVERRVHRGQLPAARRERRPSRVRLQRRFLRHRPEPAGLIFPITDGPAPGVAGPEVALPPSRSADRRREALGQSQRSQ